MNPQTLKALLSLFSMKQEIKLVFYTFLVICLVPIMTVVIVTQAGFSLISGAMASQNSQTGQVDIHDPATGQTVDYINGPRIWPVSGIVTLEFGAFDPPYQVFHTGIDIADPNHQVGTPVEAFMAGTVIYAGTTITGYGTHVIIDHGHHVTSLYGHLESFDVTVGEQVQMGQVIGLRGSTGWSTGPHLHFQIDVFGIPVNPRTFLMGNPPTS